MLEIENSRHEIFPTVVFIRSTVEKWPPKPLSHHVGNAELWQDGAG
jgi:hypothetical protein